MESPLQRFLRYVAIDTQSKPGVEQVPSTPGQFELARLLVKELAAVGCVNIELTEHCHIYALLPANTAGAPAVGFISHLDTSPAISGRDVRPQVIENYDGGDIVLSGAYTMRIQDYPELARYKGQRLVVTDGTTLLGSDDKSGITEIMGMLEYYSEHPELAHGDICVGFTPDEEIGRGTDFFDIDRFGAQFAYTVDGADLGKLSFENLNSAEVKVTVKGVSIHPGRGKNKLKNAVLMGMELQHLLPPAETPSHTEGYEGYYHLLDFHGDVEQAVLNYKVSDFDPDGFEARKQRICGACEYLNGVYGEGSFTVTVQDTMRNMREAIEPHYELIEYAMQAMRSVGVEPEISPCRGGTDGVRLSFRGLPCPNLNTGGHNCHGRFECVPVESLEKITEMLVALVALYAETGKN